MENKKSSLVSMSRQKNLRIYSWYSLPALKDDQKRFIGIVSLNVTEMRPSGTFCQFYQTVTMETMTVRKISSSPFALYFQVL